MRVVYKEERDNGLAALQERMRRDGVIFVLRGEQVHSSIDFLNYVAEMNVYLHKNIFLFHFQLIFKAFYPY